MGTYGPNIAGRLVRVRRHGRTTSSVPAGPVIGRQVGRSLHLFGHTELRCHEDKTLVRWYAKGSDAPKFE